jgi:hypothetical protein
MFFASFSKRKESNDKGKGKKYQEEMLTNTF